MYQAPKSRMGECDFSVKVDPIAKRIVLEERRLTEDLHVPLAAVDEDSISSFVGEIIRVVSFRTANRALLVRVPVPAADQRSLPIWQLGRSALIHPPIQLWVHIKYTAYRNAYKRAFPQENIKSQVLHHTTSRRKAEINGYQYVRLSPIPRRVNSSMALPERWYANLPHADTDPASIRKGAMVRYADLDDLLVIMGVVLGGKPMNVVNEAQYLVDDKKLPWEEPNSPLKECLRELGESIPKPMT